MPPRIGEGSQGASQRWLAGADDSLDNFFTSKTGGATSSKAARKSSTTSQGGVKRKRASNDGSNSLRNDADTFRRIGTTVSSTSGVGKGAATTWTEGKGKGREREVLGDLTGALQNSPHRRPSRRSHVHPTPNPTPTSVVSKSKTGSKTSKETEKERDQVIVIEDSSSSDADTDSGLLPKRLCSPSGGRTPSRPLNSTRSGKVLPTPPSSSIPTFRSRKQTVDVARSSSPISSLPTKEDNDERRIPAQTPFTFTKTRKSAEQNCYPTPVSIEGPRRIKYAHLSRSTGQDARLRLAAPDLVPLDSDSDPALTSPSSSALDAGRIAQDSLSSKPRSNTNTKGTPQKEQDRSRIYMVIPSSQTQYIHYSPTKKRRFSDFPVMKVETLDESESVVVIPCTQSQSQSQSRTSSQPGPGSPRKFNKFAPLVTPGRSQQTAVLNFVVPTSQEDEVEISLLDDESEQGLGRLMKEFTRANSDDELKRTGLGYGSPLWSGERGNGGGDALVCRWHLEDSGGSRSQVKGAYQEEETVEREGKGAKEELDVDVNSPSQSSRVYVQSSLVGMMQSSVTEPDESQWDGEDEQEEGVQKTRLDMMQSSVTEPDESQWDEKNPFSLTNEAYARHLGLHRSPGPRDGNGNMCTQSSATQPDEGDEDPFPTLPPAPTSTAESNADRSAVDELLLGRGRSPHTERSGVGPCGQRNQTQSETEHSSSSPWSSMPDIASLDDTFDVGLLDPRDVRRAFFVGVARFRRWRRGRGGDSFEEGNGNGEGEEEGGEGESMPSVVREFLDMFSQSQSQSGL